MSPVKTNQAKLVDDILRAFDALGSQPGFRPAHAKGILLTGTFRPSPNAASLTNAPHILRGSTPITLRFSDSTGLPTIPDNHPQASPRGCAIRFHLAEHSHTDIIGHSVDAFPVRTAEELIEFFMTLPLSGPDAPKPTPLEKFLAAHPAAGSFLQAPKPMPVSFAKEAFYSVSAYRFTNKEGSSAFGRYRVRPEGNPEFLEAQAASDTTPNFLFDEITERIARGPVRMRIAVQVAADGDNVNDATVQWPRERREIDFGAIELTAVAPNNDAGQRHIIFDPIPRVEGIGPSDDPLLDARAAVYLASGRRRRAAH